ncbi:thioredoxin family protein [Planctomycetota bacterium]|nr:thioredoxin family protein [Planctomycetota bacterium]
MKMKFNALCKVVVLGGGLCLAAGSGLVGSQVWAQASGKAAAKAEAHEGWQVDVDLKDVFKQAKKEGKDVVVNFSGSDWCPPCIKLDETILSQKAFQDRVKDNFVLVNLDYPRQKQQSPEVKAHNDAAARKYGITGYPTLLIFDSEGHQYGKTGYKPVSPEVYAKELNAMHDVRVQKDALLAEASKLSGVERAKKIDEAVEKIGLENAVTMMSAEIAEIESLDPNDEAGLKSKYAEIVQGIKLNEGMESVLMSAQMGDVKGAIKKLDALVAKVKPTKPDVLQQISLVKAQLLMSTGEGDAALAEVQKAIDAAPGSPLSRQLESSLPQIKAEVAQMKEQAASGANAAE